MKAEWWQPSAFGLRRVLACFQRAIFDGTAAEGTGGKKEILAAKKNVDKTCGFGDLKPSLS